MQEASRGVGWDTPGNAERYAAYAAKHPLYDVTSRALVADLDLRAGEIGVDLCCGTGATTRALLGAFPEARIYALDLSNTQLAIAKRQLADERITFVHGSAERAHELLPGPCHAVVCNAAAWQLKPGAARAVGALLHEGGRFAFNLPAAFAPAAVADLCRADPTLWRFARRQADTLERAMLEEAAAVPGLVIEERLPGQVGFVEHRYLKTLHAEGFRVERRTLQAVPISCEAAFDWYSIPVFRSNVLRGVSAEVSEAVLRRAYDRWRPTATESFATWVNFLAVR
jgi:trans-aconitate methyltransferase